MNKYMRLFLLLSFFTSSALAQDLDPQDVKIPLDHAFPIALQKAKLEFPDLSQYILYSATPRVLKGDLRGLHWQFRWQEKAFPHNKWLNVRVYMKDGAVKTERFEKGTYQKEHQESLK